jgi:hypothetical protein
MIQYIVVPVSHMWLVTPPTFADAECQQAVFIQCSRIDISPILEYSVTADLIYAPALRSE